MGREIHGGQGAGTGEPASYNIFYYRPGIVPDMRIALTGTPGTGKSSVGDILRSRGLTIIEVSDIALEAGLLHERDERRGSYLVDPDELQEVVGRNLGDEDAILVGHLSHLLTHDVCIVLRCHPSVLRVRLMERGWSNAKVKENVEAEVLDSILIEAMEGGAPVYEVDSSEMTPGGVAEAILDILAGKTEKYRPGHIDWSSEVLDWY
jgi:adenylate kinase